MKSKHLPKVITAIAVVSLTFFGACSKEGTATDSSNQNTIDELQLKGTISGKVTDSANGIGIANVAVTAVDSTKNTSGYSTNTDASGNYNIPNVSGGNYTLQFYNISYKAKSIPNIKIAIDQDKKSVDAQMVYGPDSSFIKTLWERDLVGFINADDSLVTSVKVVAKDSLGRSVPVTTVTWNPIQKMYSAKVSVPQAGGELEVYTYDKLGHKTGIGKSTFDNTRNQIQGPTFGGRNWVAKISAKVDDTTTIGVSGNTVYIKVFSSLIQGKSFSFSLYSQSDNILLKTASSVNGFEFPFTSRGTQDNVLILKSTDESGNIALDTLPAFALFTDSRDGQKYKIVMIGSKIWMAQNLNYGTYINDVTSSNATIQSGVQKFCYSNIESNCNTDGALYQWHTAMGFASSCVTTSCASQISNGNQQGICPAGWHIPKAVEWDTLQINLGGGTAVGSKMKLNNTGNGGWDASTSNNGNPSGFSALPAGFRNINAGFDNRGNGAYFWDATEGLVSDAYSYTLSRFNLNLVRSGSPKTHGFSLRCVKD